VGGHIAGKKIRHLPGRNEYNRFNAQQPQPQTRSFSFQSSTVSYGGPNGAYYTSSKTRRTGSDGVSFYAVLKIDCMQDLHNVIF
jgi:myeloid leukemia factor 1